MLIGKVLDSDATLNDFDVLGTLEFIPGSSFKLVIRLHQAQRKDLLRYVADTGATLELALPNKDGSVLTKTATSFTDDRSIWETNISASESEDLIGGNLTFTLTEGADETMGWIENALALLNTGGCC